MKKQEKTTKLKKLLLGLTVLLSIPSFAANLIVEEGGTYTTIQSAINAAASGDKVIVKAKASGGAYVENISIGKTIDLVCFENNSMFDIQGDVTLSRSPGAVINIIGMKQTNGDIGISGSNSGITAVKLLSCDIEGEIQANRSNLYFDIIGCVLRDKVVLSTGDFIGNTLSKGYDEDYLLYYKNTYTTSGRSLNRIVGNKLINTYTTTVTSTKIRGVLRYEGRKNADIKNNFCRIYDGSTQAQSCISVIPEGASTCNIINNSVLLSAGMGIGIAVGAGSGENINVINNAVETSTTDNGGTSYGINANANSGGVVNISYNAVETLFDTEINTTNTGSTINETSNYTASISMSSSHGGISTHQDQGNPAKSYTDRDLTQNAIGSAGGSYSIYNFPTPNTNNARVYWVELDKFTVQQGQTLQIKAESHNR